MAAVSLRDQLKEYGLKKTGVSEAEALRLIVVARNVEDGSSSVADRRLFAQHAFIKTIKHHVNNWRMDRPRDCATLTSLNSGQITDLFIAGQCLPANYSYMNYLDIQNFWRQIRGEEEEEEKKDVVDIRSPSGSRDSEDSRRTVNYMVSDSKSRSNSDKKKHKAHSRSRSDEKRGVVFLHARSRSRSDEKKGGRKPKSRSRSRSDEKRGVVFLHARSRSRSDEKKGGRKPKSRSRSRSDEKKGGAAVRVYARSHSTSSSVSRSRLDSKEKARKSKSPSDNQLTTYELEGLERTAKDNSWMRVSFDDESLVDYIHEDLQDILIDYVGGDELPHMAFYVDFRRVVFRNKHTKRDFSRYFAKQSRQSSKPLAKTYNNFQLRLILAQKVEEGTLLPGSYASFRANNPSPN